ncbi:MSCRAMM family protein [Persicobacter psychrovividus]|uniref:Secretion system C-terminal sorting domain-containing protein n=1 Tax=Persicobacter psychrovividus TaxID=387638 RepID=A0ABN6LGY8_9BACT|nr:hypothetical protein PEPS_46270 [Persicobacter psychrovividus]
MNFKNFFAVIAIMLGTMTAVVAENQNDPLFAGGTGLPSDPHIITTPQHLLNLMDGGEDFTLWTRTYRLDADLDMTGLVCTPIGLQFTDNSIGAGGKVHFKGAFDGNGHVIKNMTITPREGQTDFHLGFIGLAGKVAEVSDGEVKNLGLINLIVDGMKPEGGWLIERVGGFFGLCEWGYSLSNCYIDGGEVKGTTAGGIGGWVRGGVIKDFYAKDLNVHSRWAQAGLIAVADSDADISNLAFYGTTSTNATACVHDLRSGTVTNSYYKDGSGADDPNSTKLTEAELKAEASFTGFDFTNTWIMGDEFPILRRMIDIQIVVNDVNDLPVENAVVSFEGTDYNTDADGIAKVGQHEMGTYSYSVTKADYQNLQATGTFVSQLSSTVVLEEIEKFMLTFNVTDPAEQAIDGATIMIGNQTEITDINGAAVFNLPAGDYEAEVSAEGFIAQTVMCTITDMDQVKNVTLEVQPKTYTANITVTDGTDPIEGASVMIGEMSKMTDAEGKVSFDMLEAGDYQLMVSNEGFVDQTVDFSVVGTDVHLMVELMPIPTYSAMITVTDGTDPIEGASVMIGEMSKMTDAEGKVSFNMLEAGDYQAKVSMEDYIDQTFVFTIVDKDVTQTVELVAVPKYSLTISVTDGTDAIEGAEVMLGDQTKTTDVDGNVEFPDLKAGDYDVVVEAEGYIGSSYSLKVVDQDVTHTFTLEAEGALSAIDKKIRLYPNPVQEQFVVQGLDADSQIVVYSVIGNKVDVAVIRTGSEAQISVSGLPAGAYLVNIDGQVERVVKL